MRKLCFLFLSFLLIFFSCNAQDDGQRKILYYQNPMDPTIKSDKPAKDSMGMDYIPVYDKPLPQEDKTSGKVLYYVSPMDPTVKSDTPQKDEMGMDYLPVYEKANDGIRLTQDQEKMIGLQTSVIKFQNLEHTIATVGKISASEQKIGLVSARFPGRIDRLLVNYTGAQVDQGTPLFEIYSPVLITGEQELLEAQRSLKAQPDSQIAKNVFDSVKTKLHLWGVTESQIQSLLKTQNSQVQQIIYSPLAGTITKLNVLAGQYIEEGTILYEISNLDKVWMEAEVYEQDLGFINQNSVVEFTPLAFPDQRFSEKISFISPILDASTRTVKIRVEVPNPHYLLKPDMFVNVVIRTTSSQKVLAVPQTAVIDTGIRKLVYVKNAPGTYSARQVELGSKVKDFYPIVQGLKEGDEVVTEANFLIDSESQLKGVVN